MWLPLRLHICRTCTLAHHLSLGSSMVRASYRSSWWLKVAYQIEQEKINSISPNANVLFSFCLKSWIFHYPYGFHISCKIWHILLEVLSPLEILLPRLQTRTSGATAVSSTWIMSWTTNYFSETGKSDRNQDMQTKTMPKKAMRVIEPSSPDQCQRKEWIPIKSSRS